MLIIGITETLIAIPLTLIPGAILLIELDATGPSQLHLDASVLPALDGRAAAQLVSSLILVVAVIEIHRH